MTIPGSEKTSTILYPKPPPQNLQTKPNLQDIEPSGGIPTKLTMYQQIHSARMMSLMLQDQLSDAAFSDCNQPGGVTRWFRRGGVQIMYMYYSM